MKIMKSYAGWIPLGTAIGVGLGLVISYFPWAGQLFKVHWLLLAAALILAGGPWGKLKLAADGESAYYRRSSWLGQIIIVQLCLGAVFFGITVCCGQTAPVLTSAHHQLFQITLTQLLIGNGLFPWGFMVLIAVGMGFYSYRRNQDAYLATLCNPVITQDFGKIAINFIGRLATTLAYGVTGCLLAILWVSAVSWLPLATGFYLAPIVLSVILLLLSISKIYRKQCKKSGNYLPLPIQFFLWVVLLAIVIWLLNGLLSPIIQAAIIPPSLLKHWLNQPWERLWLVFADSWWLLWAPMIGITLARISRGYSIRELVLATLILPLLVSIIVGLWHPSLNIAPLWSCLIAAAGLLGLLWMTLYKKATPSFILTYLAKRDHYKFRLYHSSFIKVTQTAAGFLFIYLPGGIAVVHILGLAAAIPLLMISLLGIAVLCRLVSRG